MRHPFAAEQWLPYPVELVFAFFANPQNLPRLMPAWQKARIEEIAVRIDEVKRSPEKQEPEPTEIFVPAPLRAGMNLNKRVHAMRMLRRGEDVSYISAALGVPRREVELLIRVQSIGRARLASAGSD